jgi:hypothetical protein
MHAILDEACTIHHAAGGIKKQAWLLAFALRNCAKFAIPLHWRPLGLPGFFYGRSRPAPWVIAAMVMFGCAYYPWWALSSFRVLPMAVRVNPLVYASEGLRGTLAPRFPHLPIAGVLTVLALAALAALALGLHHFDSKAVN